MFLLIDKPKGMTSHDVVNKIRKLTGVKRVGHGGTLDPNATGLLVIGIGRESTKKLGNILLKTEKTYEGEIILGEERTTDDIKGMVVDENKSITPSKSEVLKCIKDFEGAIKQSPPQYSAVKVKGKKSYELARKGRRVNLDKREIFVKKLNLIQYDYPVLKVLAEVSSGTYIRSLARDIGRKLKTFAYLNNLRRIKVGNFAVKDAVKIDNLNETNWKKFTFDID